MKVLAVGAHFDDIELNCSGTLMKAKERGAKIYLVVCTSGAKGGEPANRLKEQEGVNDMMNYDKVFYLKLDDGELFHGFELINKIDEIIQEVDPDYIFTHTENDFHQDHVAVAKAVKSANRSASASLFSFPSQDIKLQFEANMFVNISEYFEKKLTIVKQYVSQSNRPWLNHDTIIARNIGTGIAKYVEKFHVEFLKL